MIHQREEHYWQKLLKSAGTFLKRWNGNTARIWHFQPSHCFLVIRIEKKGESGNLHISASGPEFIHGPIMWDNCKIRIYAETDEQGNLLRYVIRDEEADFELKTEHLEIAENCKPL